MTVTSVRREGVGSPEPRKTRIGLECVGNNGPWSFQSEHFGSWLSDGVTTNLGPYDTNGKQPPPGTHVGTVYYQSGYADGSGTINGFGTRLAFDF